ncbi:Icc Predicted phosphohydrolases [Rhabdaerophilaceae bacterium]
MINDPASVVPAQTFTIVQVSDTHLSETHAYFIDNFRVFEAEMAELKPDLIVHTGDISFNGPVRPDDLTFAKSQLDRLPARVLCLAGNHDIGEAPRHSRLEQPLTDARLSAWRERVGPLYWSQDIGEWRLIGLDTALMASDRAEEREQMDFLKQRLASCGNLQPIVFMHMPPFMTTADDPKPTTSSVPFEAREAFFDACQLGGVKIISCGHLHVHRTLRHRGMQIVWAPTTAMVSVQKQYKRWRRWVRPGYLVWTIEGRKISHLLVEPRLMAALDVSAWTDHGGTTTNMPPLPLNRFR